MALCFRDMTFCDSKSCVTPFCVRRLTPDVRSEARKWWVTFGRGDEAPIAVSDYTMTCADYREPEE